MNPLLEITGQIAAIIVCVFVFVAVLLAIAFNLTMMFGATWLAEKVNLVKALRPTVESLNTATTTALQGTPPAEDQNAIIRTAATFPTKVQTIEKQIDKGVGKVTDVVIEFHARTVQAKTIFKAFFLPGLTHHKQTEPSGNVNTHNDVAAGPS
jgi:hypothetical protein